jgi:NDP-sugar pyrophosphorylase family protein
MGLKNLRGAILAAGEGTRLQGESVPVLKPLLQIRGKSLIHRTLEHLIQADVSEVHIIVNEASIAVKDHVLGLGLPVRVNFVILSTPSSMHSLLALAPYLAGQDALVAMVDSIMPPRALADLAQRAGSRRASQGTLALTSFVDDEKPLCVRLRGDRIAQIGTSLARARWVTAGIYYFTPGVWPELEKAEALGISKMRNFLGHLLASGFRLHGHKLPKTVDVDRPQDVRAAEEYLALWEQL